MSESLDAGRGYIRGVSGCASPDGYVNVGCYTFVTSSMVVMVLQTYRTLLNVGGSQDVGSSTSAVGSTV